MNICRYVGASFRRRTWPGNLGPDRSVFGFGGQHGHFSRSPVRTLTRRACTLLPADAHGGETSIWWRVPGTRHHALVRQSHHYRLGLMRDLAMWFCWSELSPPKPNRLRSVLRLTGQVISDRTGAYLASAAKARSKTIYICIHIYTHTHTYIYIYIYRHIWYIYIYI